MMPCLVFCCKRLTPHHQCLLPSLLTEIWFRTVHINYGGHSSSTNICCLVIWEFAPTHRCLRPTFLRTTFLQYVDSSCK